MKNETIPDGTEILLYKTQDGDIRIETRMQAETVWLTQDQMSLLFDKAKSTINEHIGNIYREQELEQSATMRKFGNSEFSTKPTNYYNLDVIISVGYRVKSKRGTQFRIWATQRLREYLIKGFVIDDVRLKESGGGNYFEELLAQIRDIRSTEKIFWRKVLDIYATSIDYDKDNETTRIFFAQVQNKMHWAAHGHTAAEIINLRVDSTAENMGLTNWSKGVIRKRDVEIAKNYLKKNELDILNRIVNAYLEFAELQALNHQVMYMRDWKEKLDSFLQLSGREILDHAGKISHIEALEKARLEYEKFHKKQLEQPTNVEKHFLEARENIKQIVKAKIDNE
ncbi:MAG: virulence RhuM family protein [Candidatus Cloacimonetes bacterium]|nr:virulence RhuM family protein [Candidatus Cloacimonadota bacterium]